MVGAETFGYDIDFLLDLDLLSFDRLMQQSRECRNMRMLEEASIMRIAVNSGFSGEDKPFEALRAAYEPAYLQEALEQDKIQQSAKRLSKLFGG